MPYETPFLDQDVTSGHELPRRTVLRSVAAGLGCLVTSGLVGPLGAEAAGAWNPAPKSRLPFWIGGYAGIDELNALMPAGKRLDLVHLFEPDGNYQETARNTADWFPRTKEAALLASGAAAGLQWTTSPFCYGDDHAPAAVWPSGPSAISSQTFLSASRPPTFTGSESAADRTVKQRRVWRMAADGWLDAVWREKFRTIKQGFFVRKNLRSIRIVLRVAHELNLRGANGGWGSSNMQRAHSIGQFDDPADAVMVAEALRRFIAVFLDVFGKVQPGIAGDFAYRGDQLWPYWCPICEQLNGFDVCLTCPSNAKLAGPDVYDFWPATYSEAEFAAKAAVASRQGWPKGMRTWLGWTRATGRLLAVGEFGLMTWTKTAGGTRPAHEGWDNPMFIHCMLDFFRDHADSVAFACYFNRDFAPAADMPASYIAPWPGMENAAIGCARHPVGAVNRCGARAWRAWMAS